MILARKYNLYHIYIYDVVRLCILIRFIIRDVRRAVLLNIAFNKKTVSHIFDRARDVDASISVNRREADFRVLSIGTRVKLLTWGLRDR